MPPRTARAPQGKNTSHGARGAKASTKSLRELYEETCRDNETHPNSVFSRSLPDKAGISINTDTIDLSSNYVGDRGALAVVAVVARCPQLKRLILRENGLRNRSIIELTGVLSAHPNMSTLDVSDNYISEGAGKAIIQLLKENPRITEVGLQNTKIDVDMRISIKELAATNAASAAATGGNR